MAKLTKIAAGALIVAGVTFGAAKGYAYWRVQSQLDELARAVSPWAELRWGGISTELGGAIEVTDLTIAPLQVPDDVAIASVRIDTGDPRFLFTGLPRRPHEAPEKLDVAVRGVRIPLKGALFDALQPGTDPTPADPCGPGGVPGPAVLAAMGLEHLELDLGAGLESPPGADGMRLAFRYATRGIDEMVATADIGGIDGGLPQLRAATVRYQPNAEAYGRMIEHCARARGADRAAYVQALVSQSDAAFLERFGAAPGPGLRDAIARYLQRPGEVKVVLRPATELLLTPTASHSPQYWIEAAGLELFVNGQLVEDLSVVTGTPAAQSPDMNHGASGDSTLSVAAGSAAPSHASYQERPLAEISDYLDYRVRVHTRDGKPPREGRLKNVDAERADVDTRHSGGHLVAHVRLEQITRLEVYTR
jgi:hypothetical protein